jgi:hypothetical protein
MSRIFLDTETCGLHGPIVLLQYAEEDGPIRLYEPWHNPVERTLELMEWIASNHVIGFNLKFDWFHFQQMYTTLTLYCSEYHTETDELDIERYANLEPQARDLGCLKPAAATDIMIHAQKSEFQSLMDRKDILIRRVPVQLAYELAAELNRRIPFDPIYFDRRKDKTLPVWQVQDSRDVKFKNVVCRFKPSSRLKALAKAALGLKDDPILLRQIAMEDWKYPIEFGYAPFAKAVDKYVKIFGSWDGKNKKYFKSPWYHTWPDCIEDHMGYWRFYDRARQYASDDVHYTRELYKYFAEPVGDDDDSVLACLVGSVRWKGFKVDLNGIYELRDEAIATKGKIPTSQNAVLRYIADACNPTEKLGLPTSSNKKHLEELLKWKKDCEWCVGEGCNLCVEHTAAKRAREVLDARHAEKQIMLWNKILVAGRLHVSLKITGTKSNRMSGDDDLNVQAVNKVKFVRRQFPLAYPPYKLCGGDFDAFEVAIAVAIYNDSKLYGELQKDIECPMCDGTGKNTGRNKPKNKDSEICDNCEGTKIEKQKIHAIFGTFIYPNESYAGIRRSAGTLIDRYTISKSGLFTWLFAGTEKSFEERLGIPKEQAKAGLKAFNEFFPNVGAVRNKTMEDFSPLYQPEGIGTKITWREPKTYMSTLLGFKRYFSLENQVLAGLFELAQNPPEHWKKIMGTVARRDLFQTVTGATQSALYGAAFALQGNVARSAINHPIQGTGAQITKRVEREIWDIQPAGYHPWRVIPLNIHDEIMAPVHPDFVTQVEQIVNQSVSRLAPLIPLLRFEWKKGLITWADK